jgi:hypothetical protein
MFLQKVQKFSGKPSFKECASLQPTSFFFRVQIWDIEHIADPKPITINFPHDLTELEVLNSWKDNIVIDLYNDCFYLHVFTSTSEKKVARLRTDND